MISGKVINDGKHLENLIRKSLRRVEMTKTGEATADDILHTRPAIDLIDKCLNDAYEHGIQYDMMRWYGRVMKCAMGSSHNKDYCVTKTANMKWRSENMIEAGPDDKSAPIVFFDVEVFPNLVLVNWKFAGDTRFCGGRSPAAEPADGPKLGTRVAFVCAVPDAARWPRGPGPPGGGRARRPGRPREGNGRLIQNFQP